MSPTYDALKKLAVGLGISVPQLFTPAPQARVNGRMAVTKAGEGAAQLTDHYEHELLAEALTQKRMLPTVRASGPVGSRSSAAGCGTRGRSSSTC
jgi:hypothetical protein